LAPTLGGAPVAGAPLVAASGTWNDSADSGSVSVFAWTWQRASTASGSGAVTVATTQGYTPVVGDVGLYLRVTVLATDSGSPGTASASASSAWVLVTAAPVSNTAPTITVIANQSGNENGSTGPITVTVNDVESAASTLLLSVTAANATLLPSTGLVLGGSGTTRTLTLTPATGQHGITQVTVTVSDGVLSASRTFTYTVTAAPAPVTPPAPGGGSGGSSSGGNACHGGGVGCAGGSGIGLIATCLLFTRRSRRRC
jgi:hypothetical protein